MIDMEQADSESATVPMTDIKKEEMICAEEDFYG